MVLTCWHLVFNRHREPWCWVETIGFDMALADGQMVWSGICRVNRHFQASF